MTNRMNWSKANKASRVQRETLYYRPTEYEEYLSHRQREREDESYDKWAAGKIADDGYLWLHEQLAIETDHNRRKALEWAAYKSELQKWPAEKIKPVVLSLFARGFVDDGREPPPSVVNRQPHNHPMLKDSNV